MRICHVVALIFLALLSRVSAEAPVRVIATVPEDEDVARYSDKPAAQAARPMRDVDVAAFITKNGDIFELPDSSDMGHIQAREEPDLEPGMSMCRYGTIVVYSDMDCDTFFTPSHSLGRPVKVVKKEEESNVEETEEKPTKEKKKTKGNKRKSSKNKRNKKKKAKKEKNQVRRKALKQRGNKKRRRNNLKRRKNSLKKKNNKNKNKKDVKRKRINNSEERSILGPLQFALLYNRH